MSLLVELDSVASVITATFPAASMKYDVPKEPTANQFVLRSQRNEHTVESRFTYKIERLYQLIFYAKDPAAALETMDKVARRFIGGTTLIPIADDSLRYIRVGSFSYSDPVDTESGLSAVIAMIPTEVRQARDQATFEKIMRVNARIN